MHINQNHILVHVTTTMYKKYAINDAGSILWKSQRDKVKFSFTCDKDIAPWNDIGAFKTEIIKPALIKASSLCERYEYESHTIVHAKNLSLQECADEAIKIYVERKYFAPNHNSTQDAITNQNNAFKQIFSYFKFQETDNNQ